MLNLDKVVRHSDQHIRIARKMLTREQRHGMGAALVSIYREVAQARYQGHEKRFQSPHSALCAGGLTRQMWVLKRPFGNMRRGDKVLRRALHDHMVEQGAEFRSIRFPKDAAVKAALAKMARVIAPLHHDVQYGFVPQRDCVQSAALHGNARTVYLIDFENAFDQVRQVEVEQILEKVFLVNRQDSARIAQLCCHEGHLYQGNPMAPALFNVRALWCADRLARLCEANGAVCTIYADDVTISHARWSHFSKGFQRTALRIVRECGLSVNGSKCKVAQVSPRKIGHYDITGLTVDFDPATGSPYVRPLHRRRVLSKAQYMRYLQSQGILFSSETAKDGTLKDLEAVESGLRNWAKRKGKPPGTQLALTC